MLITSGCEPQKTKEEPSAIPDVNDFVKSYKCISE